MPGNGHTLGALACISWGIRLECARGGEGQGDKVVGMQLYIHRAVCICVWYRFAVGFSKSDCMQ